MIMLSCHTKTPRTPLFRSMSLTHFRRATSQTRICERVSEMKTAMSAPHSLPHVRVVSSRDDSSVWEHCERMDGPRVSLQLSHRRGRLRRVPHSQYLIISSRNDQSIGQDLHCVYTPTGGDAVRDADGEEGDKRRDGKTSSSARHHHHHMGVHRASASRIPDP